MRLQQLTVSPLGLARALFWQGERRRYVRKVTALKTVTSVLLMIVIQIVIWMYGRVKRLPHER